MHAIQRSSGSNAGLQVALGRRKIELLSADDISASHRIEEVVQTVDFRAGRSFGEAQLVATEVKSENDARPGHNVRRVPRSSSLFIHYGARTKRLQQPRLVIRDQLAKNRH